MSRIAITGASGFVGAPPGARRRGPRATSTAGLVRSQRAAALVRVAGGTAAELPDDEPGRSPGALEGRGRPRAPRADRQRARRPELRGGERRPDRAVVEAARQAGVAALRDVLGPRRGALWAVAPRHEPLLPLQAHRRDGGLRLGARRGRVPAVVRRGPRRRLRAVRAAARCGTARSSGRATGPTACSRSRWRTPRLPCSPRSRARPRRSRPSSTSWVPRRSRTRACSSGSRRSRGALGRNVRLRVREIPVAEADRLARSDAGYQGMGPDELDCLLCDEVAEPRPARGARRTAARSARRRRSTRRCAARPRAREASRPAAASQGRGGRGRRGRRPARRRWPRSSSRDAAPASCSSARRSAGATARGLGLALLGPGRPYSSVAACDRPRRGPARVGRGLREPASAQGLRRGRRRRPRLPRRPAASCSRARAARPRRSPRARTCCARTAFQASSSTTTCSRPASTSRASRPATGRPRTPRSTGRRSSRPREQAARDAGVVLRRRPRRARSAPRPSASRSSSTAARSARSSAVVVASTHGAAALVPEIAPLAAAVGRRALELDAAGGSRAAVRGAYRGRARRLAARGAGLLPGGASPPKDAAGEPLARRRGAPSARRRLGDARARRRSTRRSTACRWWAGCPAGRSPWRAASRAGAGLAFAAARWVADALAHAGRSDTARSALRAPRGRCLWPERTFERRRLRSQ